ncbi:MAG: ATP-binding cassette domain-containing protein [Streptococcaceae bacterium]|jgi:cell division transport system ATP-binding protein|nr:ATP-binding cassette domain-containing protein [Streptococcaceae bacterium]
MISFEKVSYSYDDKILDNISFKIMAGEFVYLTGKSGSGKSTLMKLIAKQLLPDSGEVIIGNGLREKMELFFLEKPTQLISDKTIYENLAYYLEFQGRNLSVIHQLIQEISKEFGIQDILSHFPDDISGGEADRVYLAQGLLKKPKIILLDEPTSNLDPASSQNVLKTLEAYIKKEPTTIVLIAIHDFSLIKKIPHRELYLSDGKIRGTLHEV